MSVHPRWILTTSFAGAFVMGSAEMLVVGLLELIAHDQQATRPTWAHW